MYLVTQFPWLAVQELHAAVLFEIECGRAHWGDLFAHLESHLLRSPTKSSISSSRPSGAVLFCRDFQTGKYSHTKDHYGTIRNERKWLQLKSTNFFLWSWFSDNAAIHHLQRLIDAINTSGALLIFLPPYRPHLMPCEGVIGQVKSSVRENELVWEQFDELETMALEAFMQITDDEIANYIRHCEYL